MAKKTEKPSVEFNQKYLAALKPDPKTTWSFSDPTTPGLLIRVTPSGSKVYYFAYRMGGRGTSKQWLKVGEFSALPLIRARELARAYRTKVDEGVDPAKALKEAGNRGSTVMAACTRFMEEYAPGHLKPNSITGYQGSINKHIIPGLGKIPIKDLTRDQVAAWHRGKSAEPVGANRALAVLSSICTQAELWRLRPDGSNPCKHVDRFEEAPRVRDIRIEELEAIGDAIRALQGQHSLWALAAIQVIGLCSGRVSEVLALRRDKETYLDRGYALVRDHKTARKAGAKHLELPPAAVVILRALPEVPGNHWYFPGRVARLALTRNGLHKTWMAVREKAGVPDLHLHDFRSFAASEGQALGIDSNVTSKILGHADRKTTEKHYTKVRDRQAAMASAQISAPVAQAFGLEEKPKPNVRKLLHRGFTRVKSRG